MINLKNFWGPTLRLVQCEISRLPLERVRNIWVTTASASAWEYTKKERRREEMGEKKRKERILQEQLYTVHTNLKLKLLNLVTLKCNNRGRNGMALQIYISSKKQYLMLKIF